MADRIRFYTTEQIGTTRSLTPEGYLLCEDVPVARTGMMLYGAGEVPIQAGPDGLIRIYREPEDVFADTFLASLNAKPVVNDHPDEDVVPSNWKELAEGVGVSARKGTGQLEDFIVMDLLITSPEAIKVIQEDDKLEISLGYDADYIEIEQGYGKQTNLIANHIALVDRGRCGSRCAIGDHSIKGEGTMAVKKGKGKFSDLLSKLLRAVKAKDEEGISAATEELEKHAEDLGEGIPVESDGETHIHIHTGSGEGERTGSPAEDETEGNPLETRVDDLEARLASIEDILNKMAAAHDSESEEELAKKAEDEKLEGELEEEAPEGTGDKARKAKDSAYMADSFNDTAAMAEILVPGIRLPVFDRASDPRKTLDAVCKLRRNALDLAYMTPDGRDIIETVHGKGLDVRALDCGAVRTLFRAAAAAKIAQNRTKDQFSSHRQHASAGGVKKPVTPADLNRFYAEHYKS